jgi:glutathione peroxidase
MNDLTEKFAGKFTCLGFPTNQFGKQTNEKDWELLPMLAHVRPGGGFVPNFPIFTKTEANGEGASDLFKFLRSSLGAPSDDFKGQGSDYVISTKNIIWTPVTRTNQRPVTAFERFGPGKDRHRRAR